jgi:hypothetical protein
LKKNQITNSNAKLPFAIGKVLELQEFFRVVFDFCDVELDTVGLVDECPDKKKNKIQSKLKSQVKPKTFNTLLYIAVKKQT